MNKEDLYTVMLILVHRKISTEDLNASSLLHLAALQGNVTILQLLLWVIFIKKFVSAASLGLKCGTHKPFER
jgi:hypothetical protein